MKNKILILLLLSPLLAASQPAYQSRLSEVPSKGFYIIDLPIAVRGYARADLSDLRILNATGEQTPYLIRQDVQITDRNEFIPYPIRLLPNDNHSTRILIKTQGDTISTLVLNIKNADTYKIATLKGSTDTVNWFTVKDRITLSGNFNRSEPSTLQAIDFPVSDYPYYLLVVNDSLAAPLNITEIGHMDSEYQVLHNLAEVPTQATIVNRADTTIVALRYTAPYPICGIRLFVSSPEFYRRTAFLINRQGHIVHTHTLSSDRKHSLYLPYEWPTDSLNILISNGDNPPLKIDSVKSYSDRLFLIAYFSTSGDYSLTYSDSIARQPNYDLTFFADKIPAELPHLTLTSTETLHVDTTVPSSCSFMRFLRKYGIWLLIGAISIQILSIARKMLKE